MIRNLALALAAVAFLSACGSDPEPSTSTLAVTTNSDIAELLGTPFTEAEVSAEFERIHGRSESLIAECMADAGFDYVPAPFQAGVGQPIAVTDTSLGIADQYFGAFTTDFEPPAANPNDDIIESLSADDRLLYSRALEGESSAAFDPRFATSDSLQASDDPANSQSGCRFDAQRTSLAETDRNQELIDEYTTLRSGMFQTDQRLIRARVEWAQCMAEAGFNYRDEPAMRTDLGNQALAVLQDLVELRDQGVEMVPGQDPPPEAAMLIDTLRDREAKVAAAHAQCRELIDDAIAEVRADTDELFLERNS